MSAMHAEVRSLCPLFILTALVGAALFTAGCARRETPVAEGLRTRTLLIGNSAEPADLDPHVVDAYTDMIILCALHEGLTVLDETTSQGRPGVAERWEVSADGLAWTFHLRPNARWSNGDALTARDFAFSFQRILTPALGAPSSYLLWAIKNAEAFNQGKLPNFSAVGVEVVDDRTLRLKLEHPVPYLPALAAHCTWLPVHCATLEKFGAVTKRGTAWTRPGNLVSNGPFTLAAWTPNARLVIAKNPLYWDAARTGLERIVFSPTEKSDVEERAFRAGQLHLSYDVPAAKIPVYRKEAPAQLRLDPLLNTWYMNFNVAKPPLDNAKVRRALALAIDREAISRTIFHGARAPAHSFTPPDCGGYTARARIPTDYAGARQLLAEAGFPGGKGLPVLPVQVLNDSNLPPLMEAIQAMWQRELGVRSTIEPFEQKTWLQNQQTKAHTIGLMGWVADFADPLTFLGLFVSTSGNNWTNWSNPDYDRLIAQTDRTADPQIRLEIFQQAEALLLESAPVTPLNFGARTYLIHPAVKNWAPSPLGFHRFQAVELKN
jgi:oligopeptide transport system substrate-binding protein